ncbi:MAG: glycosyltransferase family 9 protein [Deltaproteobacteria bacterium]|nr:glycosyltransferase family 9 protein [Deltaproteobacteria bacterium]
MVVFKLDNAGDVVLSSLVMPAVAEALGGGRIYYVVKKGLGPLLSQVDCVSGVIEVPGGLGHCSRVGADERKGLNISRRIIKKAMAELRPALIIDLRPTALGNYGALAARLYGARHRVTLDRIRLKENYGQGRKMKWKRHEAETFCAALEEAGILKRHGDYRSTLTFWKRPVGAPLSGKRYFLIQPGAVWEYKKWPERSYATLIDSLSALYPDLIFVLVGSGEESGVCSRVCEMTGRRARERVVDLAGKTTFAELLCLVGNADMVVANDSGVAHMAGAFGVRTVVFFGPSSPERFKPLSERQGNIKVFHHKLHCNPCDQHQCIEGPASYCLTRITPAEVVEVIRSIMGEGEDLEKKDNQPAQEHIASNV